MFWFAHANLKILRQKNFALSHDCEIVTYETLGSDPYYIGPNLIFYNFKNILIRLGYIFFKILFTYARFGR